MTITIPPHEVRQLALTALHSDLDVGRVSILNLRLRLNYLGERLTTFTSIKLIILELATFVAGAEISVLRVAANHCCWCADSRHCCHMSSTVSWGY